MNDFWTTKINSKFFSLPVLLLHSFSSILYTKKTAKTQKTLVFDIQTSSFLIEERNTPMSVVRYFKNFCHSIFVKTKVHVQKLSVLTFKTKLMNSKIFLVFFEEAFIWKNLDIYFHFLLIFINKFFELFNIYTHLEKTLFI